MSQITTNIPLDRHPWNDIRQRRTFQILSDPGSGNIGGTSAGDGLQIDPDTGQVDLLPGAGVEVSDNPLLPLGEQINVLNVSLPQNNQIDPSVIPATMPLEFNTAGHLKVRVGGAASPINQPGVGTPERIAGVGLQVDRFGIGVNADSFRAITIGDVGLELYMSNPDLSGAGVGLRRGEALGTIALDAKSAALQQGLPWCRIWDITGAQVKATPGGNGRVQIFPENEMRQMNHIIKAVTMFHYAGTPAMLPTNPSHRLFANVGVSVATNRWTFIPFWFRSFQTAPNDPIPQGAYDVRFPSIRQFGAIGDYVGPSRESIYRIGEQWNVTFRQDDGTNVVPFTVPDNARVRVMIIGVPVSTIAGPQPLDPVTGIGSWAPA